MRYCIFLLLFLFLFCPTIKAQSTKSNGDLWFLMSDTEKHFFVSGYCAGFDDGFNHMLTGLSFYLLFDTERILDRFVPKDKLDIAKNSYKTSQKYALGKVGERIRDNRVTITNVKEKMNSLYLEKSNRKISMDTMIELAVDSIMGIDISERILNRRKYYNDPDAYWKELLEK